MSSDRLLAVATLTLLLALLGQPALTAHASSGAPEAAPTIIAASGTIRSRGPEVTLPIQVTNVQQLGAATILLTYDPALVKPIGCRRSTSFDVGLCNTNYDRDGDGKADSVLFNAVSLTGVDAATTPVTLASISWQAPPPGMMSPTSETPTALGLQVKTFTDVDAKPLGYSEQSGQLIVLPAYPRLYLPVVRR